MPRIKPHHRHRHGSGGRKAYTPPPPPPTLLHVVSVTDGGGNLSRWLFDRDIAAPVGWLPALTVNGASPVGVTRPSPRTLELAYPLLVAGGAWACPADAEGIQSVEGYKLAAGSGAVG